MQLPTVPHPQPTAPAMEARHALLGIQATRMGTGAVIMSDVHQLEEQVPGRNLSEVTARAPGAHAPGWIPEADTALTLRGEGLAAMLELPAVRLAGLTQLWTAHQRM